MGKEQACPELTGNKQYPRCMDAKAGLIGSENAHTTKAGGYTFRTCARTRQRGGGVRSHPAHSAGRRKTKIENQTNTISFPTYTVRKEKTGSLHNGGPRNSAKEHAHGADDMPAEKESDENVTMAEKGSGKTVMMSQADTISRTEGGANGVQL